MTTLVDQGVLTYDASVGKFIFVSRWVSYFDDTYWNIDTDGTWDVGNQEWDSAAPDGENDILLNLIELGTWVNGFRPTKLRITHDASPPLSFVRLWDIGRNLQIGSANNYVSGAEITLTFGAADIQYLDFQQASDESAYSVTNIEFLLA